MTHIAVRQIQGEEMVEAMYPLTHYAFVSSPPFADQAEWQERARQREGVIYFALYEENAAVAIAASTAMTQQVRGSLYNMGGIWGGATHPAARRKGYAWRVLKSLLAAIRESGQPLSCLYPFRESFYERLGYVTFPLEQTAQLSPSSLLPLVKKDLGGRVERVLIGEGFDTYYDYLHRLRRQIHGMAFADHPDRTWARRNTHWLALAKVDGELVGLMRYNLKGEEVTEFKLSADRFYYHTSQGKYLLLQWLALHADQAGQVELSLAPFEHPETWLADIKVKTESMIRAPMGRVVDVAKLGGMHTGPGQFSARVGDPFCPWNEGTWQFETVGGVLRTCASDRADCDLSIHALAALIYGTHDPSDFAIRGWGNPTPETQTIMRTMFPPLTPYLHEWF